MTQPNRQQRRQATRQGQQPGPPQQPQIFKEIRVWLEGHDTRDERDGLQFGPDSTGSLLIMEKNGEKRTQAIPLSRILRVQLTPTAVELTPDVSVN